MAKEKQQKDFVDLDEADIDAQLDIIVEDRTGPNPYGLGSSTARSYYPIINEFSDLEALILTKRANIESMLTYNFTLNAFEKASG